MSSYRRFVAYLYEYDREMKKENRGFVKVEARNGNCMMEVHMQCPNLAPEQNCRIYGFIRKKQELLGIKLGECKTAPGKIDCKIVTRADSMNGEPVRLEDLGGMILLVEGGGFYGTQWDDEVILPSAFREPQKTGLSAGEEKKTAEKQDRNRVEGNHNQEEASKAKWENIPAVKEKGDISEEPKKDWTEREERTLENETDGYKGEQRDWEEGTEAEPPGREQMNWEEGTEAEPLGREQVNWEEGTEAKPPEREQMNWEEGTEAKPLGREQMNWEEGTGAKPPGREPENWEEEAGPGIPEKSQDNWEEKGESIPVEEQEPWEGETADMPMEGQENPTEEKETGALKANQGEDVFWPFEDGEIIECQKMTPADFRYFPKRVWPMRNNRFLLHGYQQFGHLLLGKLRGTGQYVLGVPGIYQQQERMMANMFGFPHFKSGRIPEFSGIPGSRGGYWYRLIDTPNFNPGNRF